MTDTSKLPVDPFDLKSESVRKGSFDPEDIRRWMAQEGWPEAFAEQVDLDCLIPHPQAMSTVNRILVAALKDEPTVERVVVWCKHALCATLIPGHVRGRDDLEPMAVQIAFYARHAETDSRGERGQVRRYGLMMVVPRGMPWGDTLQ